MSSLANIASKLDSQDIILKPRDLIVFGCIAGFGIGVGAFGLFSYFSSNRESSFRSKHNYPSGSRPERLALKTDEFETDTFDTQISPGTSPKGNPLIGMFPSTAKKRISLLGYTDPSLFRAISELSAEEQLKTLKQQNTKLANLLTMTENMHYNVSGTDNFTPDDIETMRALFDSIDTDEDGCISGIQALRDLYSLLGEPITEQEAQNLLKNKKLIPDESGQIAFQNFLPFWQLTHRGAKKNEYYSKKFKFLCAKMKGDFDINNIVVTKAGMFCFFFVFFVFAFEVTNETK